MKVLNRLTNKEHNITKEIFESWSKAGIPLKVLDIEKPQAIKTKEADKAKI